MIIDAPHPDNGGDWWAAKGTESPDCYELTATSRPQVIAEAVAYGWETFHIIQAVTGVPRAAFTAEDLIQAFDDQNQDAWGEDGMDMADTTPEQDDELTSAVNAVMEAWLDKHNLRPTAWNFDEVTPIEIFHPGQYATLSVGKTYEVRYLLDGMVVQRTGSVMDKFDVDLDSEAHIRLSVDTVVLATGRHEAVIHEVTQSAFLGATPVIDTSCSTHAG